MLMDAEDGEQFIKNLAYFVRTHEKALANALQLQRQSSRHGLVSANGPSSPSAAYNPSSSSTTWANALSLPYLNFTSHNIKPAKLTLTPHHLFYLLSRFEELAIAVGPMNVRLENIHTDASPANYVSFLNQAQRKKNRGTDRDSMHSVSSIRSVMSGMSALWAGLGLSSKSAEKTEKQKAAVKEDLKYLYSAFTKVPCLRLAPDHKAPLIQGYEEFPFDTAVPLFAFKNVSALEICDVDFRQFHGWDRLADQLRSLTVKRAGVEDPTDLLINVVLDDMDRRRRRSAKMPTSPIVPWSAPSPHPKQKDMAKSDSAPNSPASSTVKLDAGESPRSSNLGRVGSTGSKNGARNRTRSVSPARPSSSRHGSSHSYGRSSTPKLRRSSGSSSSSIRSSTPRGSSSNLLSFGLPSSKWRFLRHLSLADNGLTSLSAASISPLANTLCSLDLSANLFTEIPDSLATLVSLTALNLSHCMIDSLHSLARNPLPAITQLNLRANRLTSLAGIQRLLSLERADLRENRLTDPTELARLTSIPNLHAVFVNRNPFVRTHSNYRITIFNLFRSTPGYAEDVLIDAEPPSYKERKHLVDRAPEPPNVPVIKPPLEDEVAERPPVAPLVILHDPFAEPKPRSSTHQRSKSEHTLGSQKRKKGSRRRVIELSRQEGSSNPTAPQTRASDAALNSSPEAKRSAAGAKAQSAQPHRSQISAAAGANVSTAFPQPELPVLNTSTATANPTAVDSVSKDPISVDFNGELYRKKIEALRNDLGSGWLSALGDDARDSQQHTNACRDTGYGAASGLAHPGGPVRTPSGIVSTGRTLG